MAVTSPPRPARTSPDRPSRPPTTFANPVWRPVACALGPGRHSGRDSHLDHRADRGPDRAGVQRRWQAGGDRRDDGPGCSDETSDRDQPHACGDDPDRCGGSRPEFGIVIRPQYGREAMSSTGRQADLRGSSVERWRSIDAYGRSHLRRWPRRVHFSGTRHSAGEAGPGNLLRCRRDGGREARRAEGDRRLGAPDRQPHVVASHAPLIDGLEIGDIDQGNRSHRSGDHQGDRSGALPLPPTWWCHQGSGEGQPQREPVDDHLVGRYPGLVRPKPR